MHSGMDTGLEDDEKSAAEPSRDLGSRNGRSLSVAQVLTCRQRTAGIFLWWYPREKPVIGSSQYFYWPDDDKTHKKKVYVGMPKSPFMIRR